MFPRCHLTTPQLQSSHDSTPYPSPPRLNHDTPLNLPILPQYPPQVLPQNPPLHRLMDRIATPIPASYLQQSLFDCFPLPLRPPAVQVQQPVGVTGTRSEGPRAAAYRSTAEMLDLNQGLPDRSVTIACPDRRGWVRQLCENGNSDARVSGGSVNGKIDLLADVALAAGRETTGGTLPGGTFSSTGQDASRGERSSEDGSREDQPKPNRYRFGETPLSPPELVGSLCTGSPDLEARIRERWPEDHPLRTFDLVRENYERDFNAEARFFTRTPGLWHPADSEYPRKTPSTHSPLPSTSQDSDMGLATAAHEGRTRSQTSQTLSRMVSSSFIASSFHSPPLTPEPYLCQKPCFLENRVEILSLSPPMTEIPAALRATDDEETTALLTPLTGSDVFRTASPIERTPGSRIIAPLTPFGELTRERSDTPSNQLASTTASPSFDFNLRFRRPHGSSISSRVSLPVPSVASYSPESLTTPMERIQSTPPIIHHQKRHAYRIQSEPASETRRNGRNTEARKESNLKCQRTHRLKKKLEGQRIRSMLAKANYSNAELRAQVESLMLQLNDLRRRTDSVKIDVDNKTFESSRTG